MITVKIIDRPLPEKDATLAPWLKNHAIIKQQQQANLLFNNEFHKNLLKNAFIKHWQRFLKSGIGTKIIKLQRTNAEKPRYNLEISFKEFSIKYQ